MKEVDRVLEKLVRSYERDPARVLDYCRQARDVRAISAANLFYRASARGGRYHHTASRTAFRLRERVRDRFVHARMCVPGFQICMQPVPLSLCIISAAQLAVA